MKKLFPLLFSLIISKQSFSQGGTWAWVSGLLSNNHTAAFGTQGIPSVNNHPPSTYEAAEWKDKQGNFWLYIFSNLWKYELTTNEWTWVNGPGSTFIQANYGTRGVAAPSNNPGPLQLGANTWTDTTGNIWMFGGAPNNVMWKYDMSINNWIWMNGDTVWNSGSYGVQGIPGVNNSPSSRTENNGTWTDSLNNLWLFGGQGILTAALNDLCMYNISTNEWTWMNGGSNYDPVPNYGAMGVPGATNDPGGRWCYAKWKDVHGHFWLMGGPHYDSTAAWAFHMNDLWMYDPAINQWTWMYGPNTRNDSGSYLNLCTVGNNVNQPRSRMEHRSVATDNCGRFWMLGGVAYGGKLNDLWMFDPERLVWHWMSGSNALDQPGIYSPQGVASPTSLPPCRAGANAWWGNDNKFYIYGGSSLSNYGLADLWAFDPDSNCIALCTSSVSVNEIFSNANKIAVYPNPAFTEININIPFDISNDANIRIINMLGVIVREEKIKNRNYVNINIEMLQDGFYNLQVLSGNISVTTKFIKE